jgi:hypothetical protein
MSSHLKLVWKLEELPPSCLVGTELERITSDLFLLISSFYFGRMQLFVVLSTDCMIVGTIKSKYTSEAQIIGSECPHRVRDIWTIEINRKGQLVLVDNLLGCVFVGFNR